MHTHRLTAALARSLSSNFVAIGIATIVSDENVAIQWVKSKARTQVALGHIDLSSEHRGAINAMLTDRLYLKTDDGDVYHLDLYEVENGEFGYALGDGVYWRTDLEFASAIAELFALDTYSSSSRHHLLAPLLFASDDTNSPGNTDDWHGARLGVVPARVIFYALDHNEVFARTLLAAHPDEFVISPLNAGSTPAVLAQRLALLKQTRTISQIIFASHGAAAVFQAGEIAAANSDKNVGLYPNNATPTWFGQQIRDSITEDGTITLLSCKTAATSGLLDGQTVLAQLAAAAKAWVVASNADVMIDGPAGIARTDGTIYACPKDGPVGVWHAAQPGQIIPLTTLPALAPAA